MIPIDSKEYLRLYLDTEFTNLVPGNKLISIALVDENGEYFYAELADTYKMSDCSEFVHVNVLPYLIGGKYSMNRIECSLRLGNWIESRNRQCILVMDNPSWDYPHILSLLHEVWPENLQNKFYIPIRVPDHIEEDLILEHNFTIHRALDDAKLMSLADKLL